MALINQNSIIGVTSITSPSASNVLTVHTNDTTERLRVSTSGLSFSGTNASLDISGNATFNGNVSIGGTLTYEDVTNIDAVGIITARSGINVTSGNVDIGGATHSRNLTVHDATNSVILIEGASNGTSNLMFADENDEDVGMLGYNHASNYLAFTVNAAERLRITSAGKVGIGTDDPKQFLSVVGRATFDQAGDYYGAWINGNSDADSSFNVGAWYNVGGRLRDNGNHVVLESMNTSHYVQLQPSGGNVGVGEAGPNAKLHVTKDNDVAYTPSQATQNSNNQIKIENHSTTTDSFVSMAMRARACDFHLGVKNNGADNSGRLFLVHQDTVNTEVVSVLSTGNVGVGTTNAQAKLDVIGEIRASGIAITESYPTISPSLNLNFAKSRSLGPHVTFSRSSNATYVGRDGLVKTVGHDQPRFDHDPVTGESLGFLSEEERTNVTTYSTDYTNAVYNKLTATVSANQAVSPDGTTTADLLYPNSSGSGRGLEISSFVLSTGKWTTSLYVKSAGLSWIALYGVNGGARAYFDVSNGTKGSANGGGDPIDDWDIIDAGNGWYRCYITIDLQNAGGTEYFYIYFGSSDNSTTVTANGTNGVYIWGTQVEKGSFPTSYIPTSGAAVTRQPDRARIVGKSFSDFFNTTEGTLVVQGRTSAGNSVEYTNQPVISINAGNSTNRIIMFDRDGATLEWNVVDGSSANGSGVLLDNTTSYTGANDYIMCGTYKNGAPTRAVANGLGANGTIIESSGKNDTVNVFSQMDIGNELGTRECSSPIKQVRYYPLSLSDDQIKTLVK